MIVFADPKTDMAEKRGRVNESVRRGNDPKRKKLCFAINKRTEQYDDERRNRVTENGIERPQRRAFIVEHEKVVEEILNDRQRDKYDAKKHDESVWPFDIRIEQNDEQKAE